MLIGRLQALLPIAAMVCMAGCRFSQHVNTASQAVNAFHKSVEAGKFRDTYDAADAELRQATNSDYYVQTISRMKAKMGRCDQGAIYREFVNSHPGGTVVQLWYSSHCENGPLDEVFRFRLANGQARLLSYRASTTLVAIH